MQDALQGRPQMLGIAIGDLFHLPSTRSFGSWLGTGFVELDNHLVDILGVATVPGQQVGRTWNGELAMGHVYALIVVEKYVQDTFVRIAQKHLQWQPPAVPKVLPLIHNDGIVANTQGVGGIEKRFGQLLVEERVVILLDRQFASPLSQVVAQSVKTEDIEVG